MKFSYALLAVSQLMALGAPVFGQPTGPLPTPAQTIPLQNYQAMCGAVQLPNHRTVIFVADLRESQIQMKCLAPDGTTAWQTNVVRMQQLAHREELDLTRLLADLGSNSSKQAQAREALEVAAKLKPLEVLTSGNILFTKERLSEEAYRTLPKEQAKRFAVGQLWIQRLDEEGKLTAVTFAPRPEPKSKKAETTVLAYFVEDNAYLELVRETNEREGSTACFMDRYDLLTRKQSRQPLSLPATPPKAGSMSGYTFWYHDWAYLGHRTNQTYLFRRLLVTEPKQKAGRQPLTYQVLILDNNGTPAGGFSTTLALKAGTGAAYSGGSMGGIIEQAHAYQSMKSGNSYLDQWNISSGGFGDFYLDYATGDVLIYGEYGGNEHPEMATKSTVDGFFFRRYSSQGTTLQQVQYPYDAAMRKANDGDFEVRYYRNADFSIDPLSGRMNYTFRQANLMSLGGRFDLFFNADLSQPRSTYEKLNKSTYLKHSETEIHYPGPVWLSKPTSIITERRTYSHATLGDAPVYAALEKLHAKVPADNIGYQLYLTATGGGKALVVECPQLVGGNVRVFTF